MNNLHWQSSGIRVLLRKYYIAISDTLTGSFLDVFFLLSAAILWELHENPRRKDWVTKRVHRNIFLRHIIFFDCTTFFIYHFCCFLRPLSLSLPKWRFCWMASLKIRNITMKCILCDDIMSERSKIWNSLAI